MSGPGWKQIPIGGVIEQAGKAFEYKTGDWRTFKPVVDLEKCRDCLFCWIYCPDLSVELAEGKMKGFDYDHCKGCGICASVCPSGCIEMVKEKEQS